MNSSNESPILSVRDIGISFGNNRVLESVNFDLHKGETLGVIGPNGAGKTVLLNILTGILRPDHGEIVFNGIDISKKSITERTVMGIGRTFQVPRSFENMTAYENGMVGAIFGSDSSEKVSEEKASEILDIIGLKDKKRIFAGKLGLLDRKRLEIGVALASDPKVLLLDEASGGLTESEVSELLEIISGVKAKGIGIIWIEHVLQTMYHGAERILLLAEGRDMLCGLPEEVMNSKEVEEVYLGTSNCGLKKQSLQDPQSEGDSPVTVDNCETIMTVAHLDVCYGDFQAIYDLSMSFPKGKIISIIGSNGAGKSTLLNAIMGVNKIAGGCVSFEGEDITRLGINSIVAKGIAMSPEGSGVFEDMSIEENLLMGAHLQHAWRQKDRLISRAYDLFPSLKEKSKQLATFLSGGQRQMLAIARALMSDPKLLICDEISLGLAPTIINDIYDRIFEVNESGVTVIFVEQEVKRSLECSDYSYVLVKGRVVIEGETGKLSESEVKDAYFGINKYA